jgi:hypothetical protein
MASMAAAAKRVNLADMVFLRPAEECMLIVEMVYPRSVGESVTIGRTSFFDSRISGMVVLAMRLVSGVGRILMSL